MTASATRKWTDRDILAMPRDGRKRQIVGGELVMMSPAGFGHGSVIARLTGELSRVVYENGLGELADGQTGYRMASGDLFCPDISFVTAARAREHLSKNSTFFMGAPDLFVEVLSPDDTVEVLQEKLEQFFREGARLAWIVNPRKRVVYVHRDAHSSITLGAGDVLQGEEVVPGFSLPLSRLFV